jgi:predicted NBD/HSP70 family sugar kinase
MCLSPDGPTCYCGKKGCIETFCSADSLESSAGMELDIFFELVHSGDAKCCKLWRNYLRSLALAVDNIRMIVDCDFILGGYLIQYFNDKDIKLLTDYVKEQCAFRSDSFKFTISKYGDNAICIGAALTIIDEFLNNV